MHDERACWQLTRLIGYHFNVTSVVRWTSYTVFVVTILVRKVGGLVRTFVLVDEMIRVFFVKLEK